MHRLRAGIDDKGEIVGWDQVIVGQSFMKGSPFEAGMIKNGVDQTMVEGASTLPYQIPNLRVSAHMAEVGVPTLWWRSVGSTHTAFSTETFLDQLADTTGADPLQLRRKLLTLALAKPGMDDAGKERVKRHLGVLELAAEKAGWGQPLRRAVRAASRCTSPSRASSRMWPRCRWARTACRRWSASSPRPIAVSQLTQT